MSILLTKTFSPEPDLVLELEGAKGSLELELVAQGFRREKIQGDDIQEEETEAATKETPKNSNIRILMHVSSKHMTDAGDFFHVQKKWREHLNQNHRPLKFSEPNVRAFSVLMHIFHMFTDHLNYQYVDFNALFQFCKLIDLYNTPRALSPWAYIWYGRVHGQIPTEPSKDAQKWLFIMYLLKRETDFRNLGLILHRQYAKADLDQLVEAPPACRIQDM